MHAILICYCRSQLFEICHIRKEFIGHLYVVTMSCILFTRPEHLPCLVFSMFFLVIASYQRLIKLLCFTLSC